MEVLKLGNCLFEVDTSYFGDLDLDDTHTTTYHEQEVLSIKSSSPVPTGHFPPEKPPEEQNCMTSPLCDFDDAVVLSDFVAKYSQPKSDAGEEPTSMKSLLADNDELIPCSYSARHYRQPQNRTEEVPSIKSPLCDSDELMPTEHCPPKNPPEEIESMKLQSPISTNCDKTASGPAKVPPYIMLANYLRNEERCRVLNSSYKKLKKIKDFESSLRSFLLLNNVIKRVQKEQQQQYYNDNFLNKQNGRDSNDYDWLMDDLDDIVTELNAVDNSRPVSVSGNNLKTTSRKRSLEEMENCN